MEKIDFLLQVPPTDSHSRACLSYESRLAIFYSPGTRGKNCIYKLVNNNEMEVATKDRQAHFFFITKVAVLDSFVYHMYS